MGLKSVICLIIFSFLKCMPAIAGVTHLTFHSRANCANNESISWHLGHSYLLRTKSFHYQRGVLIHTADTGLEATWRSAAVHWGEGTGGWMVIGEHYGLNQSGNEFLLAKEQVTGCSFYDGWWDH